MQRSRGGGGGKGKQKLSAVLNFVSLQPFPMINIAWSLREQPVVTFLRRPFSPRVSAFNYMLLHRNSPTITASGNRMVCNFL